MLSSQAKSCSQLVNLPGARPLIMLSSSWLHVLYVFPGRSKLSELHGNMFVEKCDRCGTEYVRQHAVTTVGLKKTGEVCERKRVRGHCRYVLFALIIRVQTIHVVYKIKNNNRYKTVLLACCCFPQFVYPFSPLKWLKSKVKKLSKFNVAKFRKTKPELPC